MSSSIQATVLAVSGNHAVVKLESRQFPGILIQGDGMLSWSLEIAEAMDAAKGNREVTEILNRLVHEIEDVRNFYEQTLRQNGIRIPY